MPSVLAIISKKVFDKECPAASAGEVYETSLYRSGHKVFDGLGSGDIYLVTARPGDKMWLVGVLRAPKKSAGGWSAQNETPVTDITSLRATIKFESGKGISQKKGALGMSLQTPRALSAADVKLLEAGLGGSKKPMKTTPKATPEAKATPEPAVTSMSGETEKGKPQGVIQYTPEALAFLNARSAADVIARSKELGTLKSQWKKLSKHKGTFPSKPSFGEHQARALELLVPEEPAVLEGDDAAILIAATNDRDCYRYLIQRIGLLRTLEALIRAHDFPNPRGYPPHLAPDQPMIQNVLFEAFLIAEMETQTVFKKSVEEAYASVPLRQRISLLACLPTRVDWGNECAQAYLEGDVVREYIARGLLGVVDDPAIAKRLIAHEVTPRVDMVPGLRENAVPLFAEALAKPGGRPREDGWFALGLSCIGTPESAEVLAAHMHKKGVRQHAMDFFARHPHLAPAALGELTKKKTKVAELAREILENIERAATATVAPSDDAEIAGDDEVPPILKDPPWHTKTRTKRKLVTVPGLAVPDSPARLHWAELPLLRWKVENFVKHGKRRNRAELKVFEESSFDEEIRQKGSLPARLIQEYPDADTFMSIESPALIPSLLERSTSRTHWLYYGLKWIERYPEAACAGLVPLAVRKKNKMRSVAETWLRYLARLGHAELALAVAREHGEKCAQAVEEILAADEREECPTKPPKMPPFFRPAELRAPKLKNGKALPNWAVERLGEMLSFSRHRVPYVGIGEIRGACDAASLSAFAWDLAQAWDRNGETQEWMLYGLLHFGDDDAVRRIAALRYSGLGSMLGFIGSDAACVGLQTILARMASGKQTPNSMYGHGPTESLRFVAACRGQSMQEVTDRLVPALDLGDERGIELDLGTQKVWGGFDENLQPRLLDADRNAIRSLPSASKVDAAKHKLAKALWIDVQQEVETLVRYQGFALEHAMVEERGWSPQEFHKRWVTHPVLNQFARAVVWVAVDEERKSIETFRIAGDRSYADSRDETWTLNSKVHEICVAHPGAWTDDVYDAWTTIFADYDLQSPLAQLKRHAGGLSKKESSKTVLSRPRKEGVDVVIEALHNAGWLRGEYGRLHVLGFRDDEVVVLGLKEDKVTMRGYRDGLALRFEELSFIVQSEVHYVLRLLS